jgi:competence protein ComEA
MEAVKTYLYFSKTERNGLLILCALIFLTIFTPLFLKKFVRDHKEDFSAFGNEIDAFERSCYRQNAVQPGSTAGNAGIAGDEPASSMGGFDPNGLLEEKWKAFGLPGWLCKRIKNFENHGGHFRSKEDVRKIYGFPGAIFARLEPFMIFPESQKNVTYSPKIRKDTLLEINIADSSGLAGLPGIGPFTAGRIIKYRERLGGFVAKEQLLEIRYFTSDRLESAAKFLTVNSSKVKKMNINKVGFKVLLKHPYANYELTKALVWFRDRYGKINNLAELERAAVIPDTSFLKLKPYLATE